MALIRTESGAKVGWEVYDNEAEALARVPAIVAARERMLQAGFDFGYCWPGEVRRAQKSRYVNGRLDASLPVEFLDEWVVTTT